MIEPALDESVRFLRWWTPEGPWVLTTITQDQLRVETKTFRNEGDVVAWLSARSQWNAYFAVNPVLHDLAKKAERTDVAALAWLHVDIDPRPGEDLALEQKRALELLTERLPAGVPAPTAIVFSGGGYQGFWRLREPLPIDGDLSKAKEAARYNIQLEILFGADSCHNIDRIMRLPGTVNWPTKKKLKKGRVPALSKLIEYHDDRVYDLSKFIRAEKIQGEEEDGNRGQAWSPSNVRRIPTDELPVPDWCKMLITQGSVPDEPSRYTSRSEALFAACCEMVRSGCPDEVVYAVITDPDYRISESVLDKGSRAESYALRQIERARDRSVRPELLEMNDRHAVVGSVGSRCLVIEELMDVALGRTRVSFQSFETIRSRYCNRMVSCGMNKAGDEIKVPLGRWWLSHFQRREFRQVVFLPGRKVPQDVYNLWQGFSCEARPGDCSLFLDHVRKIVCDGCEEHYEYLMGWMARGVQHPAERGEVAIVVIGVQGAGKGVFVTGYGSLFGRHFLQVSDPKHLVGSFNAHLRDCCVLFADEAFYPGDRAHRSILKTLITERTLSIEAKGIDMEPAPNFLHLLMASNDRWVVPAEIGDRRFFVLEASAAVAKNSVYFGRLQAQMDSGGREALLHVLLTRDLTGFDVRQRPSTPALARQKEQTLEPHKSVWLTMLKEGSFPTEWVATGFQSDDLVRLVREWDGRKCSLTTIGHFLTEELEVQKTRKNNLRLYKIDTIERERERWNSRLPELRQEWKGD